MKLMTFGTVQMRRDAMMGARAGCCDIATPSPPTLRTGHHRTRAPARSGRIMSAPVTRRATITSLPRMARPPPPAASKAIASAMAFLGG
ncbi:hypothetical protein Acsp02_52610 [Actinoplanes sp. NBRC 103695]|nr:hypothetical protein Acsp02_52610 [Actinoplanes sp. NBRC 103695]